MFNVNKKIPAEAEAYPNGMLKKDLTLNLKDCFVYEPVRGEKVKVVAWVRYPSYDFIFGVPDKTNPKYKKEVAFFQVRDTRLKKVMAGCYLDVEELEEFINGFLKIRMFSPKNNPKLWKK